MEFWAGAPPWIAKDIAPELLAIFARSVRFEQYRIEGVIATTPFVLCLREGAAPNRLVNDVQNDVTDLPPMDLVYDCQIVDVNEDDGGHDTFFDDPLDDVR
jgi:hypothetical protein